MKICILALLLLLIVLPSMVTVAQDNPARIVVAADGSGDYTTVSDALRKVRGDMDDPVTVYIKNGIYREKILLNATLHNVTIEGESADGTVISWGDYASLRNMGTSGSYTFKVEGNNITFRNLTIENSAGNVGQAVAMHTIGDRIRFINCRFLGNQDTLYTGGRASRLYFEDCYVEGTIDFIFGSATALFNRCHIHGKIDSYITAASTAKENPVGYVFYRCKVTTAPGVTSLYLGRPWRPNASTFFIECELPRGINPAGWHNWGNTANESTARYGEYGCTGDGAVEDGRVAWRTSLTADQVGLLTDPTHIFTRSLDWNPASK